MSDFITVTQAWNSYSRALECGDNEDSKMAFFAGSIGMLNILATSISLDNKEREVILRNVHDELERYRYNG